MNRKNGENLIFLISQPRAGSTMTQRILGAHPDIHTQSEPWILLHPLYAFKPQGIHSAFDSMLYTTALNNFTATLPGGEATYKATIAATYNGFYNSILEKEERIYFLDKTPRYYNIITELSEYFPKAKFIFLWRNPAAVLTSIIKTWAKQDFYRLSEWKDDLLYAPQLMLNGIFHLKERAFCCIYEELLSNPRRFIKDVCEFLNISIEYGIIDYGKFPMPEWQYGDRFTVNSKKKPDIIHKDKWLDYLNNPQIWKVNHDYLNYLGRDIISSMNYDYDVLESQLMQYKPNIDINLHTLPLNEFLNTYRSILIENKRFQLDLKNAYEGIKIRDEKIKRRNETIAQKDNTSAEKEKIIQQFKTDIPKLQSALEENKSFISKLQTIIEQKDKQIENQNIKIEHIVGEITNKDNQLVKQIEEIKKLNVEVNSFRISLKDKEFEVKQLSSEVNSLKTKLKDRDSHIARLDSDISSLKLSMQEKKSEVEHLYSEIRSLKHTLNSKELLVQQLNSVVAEKIKRLEMSEVYTNNIQQHCSELGDKLSNIERLNAKLQDENMILNETLKVAKENDNRLNVILNDKKIKILELEELIKSIERSYTFQVGRVLLWPLKKVFRK